MYHTLQRSRGNEPLRICWAPMTLTQALIAPAPQGLKNKSKKANSVRL
jgi:hypothetical protein